MTLPNDSILVTPGSGATLASHAVSSKEYEAWLKSDGAGSLDVEPYGIWVAKSGTRYKDTATGGRDNERMYLFNNDASLIVEVLSVVVAESFGSDFAGSDDWHTTLYRISALDWTGGTSITPVKADSSFGSLDADIASGWYDGNSSPPTFTLDGGALSRLVFRSAHRGTLHHLLRPLWGRDMPPIILRQGEGVGIEDAGAGLTNTSNLYEYAIIFRVR